MWRKKKEDSTGERKTKDWRKDWRKVLLNAVKLQMNSQARDVIGAKKKQLHSRAALSKSYTFAELILGNIIVLCRKAEDAYACKYSGAVWMLMLLMQMSG